MIVNAVIKGGGGLSGVRFDYDGFFEVRYGNVLALLSSGTFTPIDDCTVDLFLVGGGGGGGAYYSGSSSYLTYGGGGGGGYTLTELHEVLKSGESYPVVIGAGGAINAAGGATSFGAYSIAGGQPGNSGSSANTGGGAGGSGGGDGAWSQYTTSSNGYAGGVDGNDGSGPATPNSYHYGGKGQGSTTRAFGESDGELFASGGSGVRDTSDTPAADYTGDGGQGNAKGGAGIVLIRFPDAESIVFAAL
ncbi:MAG: hypothetical protein IJN83_06880 [Clostridia bacterium]|nr:hypothetical protein [Clostridia bacterium]